MFKLDTSVTIELDDGAFQFVEQRSGIVRLRSLSDRSYRDLHVAELAQRVVGLPPALPSSPRTLDSLPDKQRDEVIFWAAHIEEILTGKRLRGSATRPEYNLELTSFTERVATKVSELTKAGHLASRSNTLRKIKLYREHGTLGLIDQRALRQSNPLGNLDPRIQDALCEVIAAQKDKSTGTKSRLIEFTRRELLKRHKADAPALPSDVSMIRYINALTVGKHTTGSAKTRRSLGDRPDKTFKKQVQTLPGAEVQVDSTVMDVLIRTANGKTVRPVLTIMVDIATRSILAATIRLDATMSIDHVALLAQALTPGQNRPDKSSYRAAVQFANPNLLLLDSAERERLELTRPFVYPRTIMMDNGKDYLGGPFHAALQHFGINAVLSAPHTPTGKAIVERTFGSINTLFTQYLPGYVGRSPEFRGYKVEDEEGLLDIDMLFEQFDDWVLKTWQNRPHSGLRDRDDPTVKLSPNQMMTAAAEITTSIVLPLTRELYIELLPSAYRVISATGIDFETEQYDSTELHPLRGKKSGLKNQKGKWEFKYDPYNRHAIWVRSPEGGWIECPRRDAHRMNQPHHLQHQPSAKQLERSTVANTNAAITGVPLFKPASVQTVSETTFTDDEDAVVIHAFDPNED